MDLKLTLPDYQTLIRMSKVSGMCPGMKDKNKLLPYKGNKLLLHCFHCLDSYQNISKGPSGSTSLLFFKTVQLNCMHCAKMPSHGMFVLFLSIYTVKRHFANLHAYNIKDFNTSVQVL